ncbi:alpha/beta hydrolase family protein [Asaia spathodeae]|uniref:Dienelactone hydrolase n=1 Tax=Asaia spathodeae TaxID=657016 RepID=A0ABX2P3V6_9PROT|nr:hypothetical protein [Asaia spathodeae]GBR22307.1 dienelactone hydrolase [Asaia spathodeae NBRC 105894]
MSLLSRLVLSLSLLAIPIISDQALGAPVGCQHIVTPGGLELGLWYPSEGTVTHQNLGPYEQDCIADGPLTGQHRPLIVISHGTGGSWTSHLDTAAQLATSGYVVVALTEPGDNWRDQSRVTDLSGRTRALRAALDYMLSQWPGAAKLDSNRIGAFGFSAGGLTVLLALGAKPEFSRLTPWCAAHPDSFTCMMIAHQKAPINGRLPNLTDQRIRAAVIAAPALGFTMSPQALAGLRQPIQLWQAQNDRILPEPGSLEPVRNALPSHPAIHLVEGAGHFDFLAPCRPGLETLPICQSAASFDRARFHERFNAALVAFFNKTLLASPRSGE